LAKQKLWTPEGMIYISRAFYLKIYSLLGIGNIFSQKTSKN
jgi:hypothetical protein